MTFAQPEPGGFSVVVMLPGQVIEGGWLSLTVTVKLQLAVLVDVSVAVHVTVVVPFGNAVPDAGLQATVTPGQLSLPDGVANVTTAEHRFGSVLVVIGDGQAPIVGASLSLTVTVKLQEVVRFDASVAVQVTVVVPLANAVPEAGLHATVTPGQLSFAEGVV